MSIDESVPAQSASTTGSISWRRSRIIAISTLVGLALAVAWSFEFVDGVIGESVANTLLQEEAKTAAIGGWVAATVFALVSGVAGSFTACNIAAFSALAPVAADQRSAGQQLRQFLRPLGWLTLGMVVVSAVYGAVGAVIGDRLPQLSTDVIGGNFPVRLAQALVVFVVLGAFMVYLGLGALSVVPDVIRRATARWANAEFVVLGALIGLFLVGRPYPLFFKLFEYSAERHDPLLGATAFALQSLGNIVFLAVLMAALVFLGGHRLSRWITASPSRVASVRGAAFISAGVFLVVYWGVRLPAMFGYGWFPTMPWNA